MEIAKLVLQSVAVFLTLAALGYTILSAWMKKMEREHANLKAETASDIDKIAAQLAAERANRVENINRLHVRIDDMQSEFVSDLQARIGRMEGELTGVKNVLQSIQEWFVRQAGTGKKGT